ncbi:Protein of uncharacterised function, DUF393 [Serratia odorifera]|uniref:Protein of uncharacterized function, DUF393 n=1 Tax=Serratia odorifera TaxID=618 RepID=A0A3S4ENI4_SEROD|nr:DUF393 domain-containing protein [Serratia odorifera]VDZ52002.1 Protein of uncharacterised function, DUF393 [Serratia odorifera]
MNPSVISSPPLPVEPVLLFDGECNLCHRLVRFLMWADRHGRLRFATVQSSTGQEMLRSLAMPTDRFDSVVLLASGRHWLRSAAFFSGTALARLAFLLVICRPLSAASAR